MTFDHTQNSIRQGTFSIVADSKKSAINENLVVMGIMTYYPGCNPNRYVFQFARANHVLLVVYGRIIQNLDLKNCELSEKETKKNY